MYEGGKWDYVNQPKELAHYSVIMGYLSYYTHYGAVLDVGCGEGVLFDWMRSFSYSRYVGIDISQAAIDHALKKKTENSIFIKTAIQDYKPEEKFDAIVFSEVLYYLESPLQILKHYEAFLKDEGIFIVSMYCSKEHYDTPKLWKELESVYTPLDEIKVSNRYNTSWLCKVYKPSNI
jgi:2-polyprenyl-3-methyl-5-hydroxy-6-metoxy-1,4-benzoquinol methylase